MLVTCYISQGYCQDIVGELKGKKYSNKFFAISFEAPDGWFITCPKNLLSKLSTLKNEEEKKLEALKQKAKRDGNAEALKKVEKMEAEANSGKSRLSKIDEEIKKQPQILFESMKISMPKDKEPVIGTNYLVLGKVIDLKSMPKVKTGKDYLAPLDKTFRSAKIPVKPVYKVMIGARNFDVLESVIDSRDSISKKKVKATQTTYCTVVKGYAVVITTLNPPGDAGEIKEFLELIKFG